MNGEKIILSIVAVFVGLIAAGIAFYLYQMAKTIPAEKIQTISIKTQATLTPTPSPNNENFLTVETPKDESVVDSKKIVITGKTSPTATIIVTTENNDQVITPASNGDFTLTAIIENGNNLIQILAIFPSGEEKKIVRSVTYTTESF